MIILLYSASYSEFTTHGRVIAGSLEELACSGLLLSFRPKAGPSRRLIVDGTRGVSREPYSISSLGWGVESFPGRGMATFAFCC